MRPLRPFPFPLNVGTDICQISRIYRILRSPRGTRFVQRVLAPEEQGARRVDLGPGPGDGQRADEATLLRAAAVRKKPWEGIHEELARRDPVVWKSATFVAGRFAAKEAAMKAHSHRRLTFHDIIIERRGRDEARLGSGPPVARIRGEQADGEDTSAMVSISHDGDYATAVCMGYDPSVVQQGEDKA